MWFLKHLLKSRCKPGQHFSTNFQLIKQEERIVPPLNYFMWTLNPKNNKGWTVGLSFQTFNEKREMKLKSSRLVKNTRDFSS